LAAGWTRGGLPALSHRMGDPRYLELCRRMSPSAAHAMVHSLCAEDLDQLMATLLVNPVELWLLDVIDYESLLVAQAPAYASYLSDRLSAAMRRMFDAAEPLEAWATVERLYKTYVVATCDSLDRVFINMPAEAPADAVELLIAAGLLTESSTQPGTYGVRKLLEGRRIVAALVRKLTDTERWVDCEPVLHDGVDALPSLWSLGGFVWLDTAELLPSLHTGPLVADAESPVSLLMTGDAAVVSDVSLLHSLLFSLYQQGLVLTQSEVARPEVLSRLLTAHFDSAQLSEHHVALVNLNLWTGAELSRVASLLALHCRASSKPLRLVVCSQLNGYDFGGAEALSAALSWAGQHAWPVRCYDVYSESCVRACRVFDKPPKRRLRSRLDNSHGPAQLHYDRAGKVADYDRHLVVWTALPTVEPMTAVFDAPHGLTADEREQMLPECSQHTYAVAPNVTLTWSILQTLRAATNHPIRCSGAQHRALLDSIVLQ